MEKDIPEMLLTYQESQSSKHWLFRHYTKKPEPKEQSQKQVPVPHIGELKDMTPL